MALIVFESKRIAALFFGEQALWVVLHLKVTSYFTRLLPLKSLITCYSTSHYLQK